MEFSRLKRDLEPCADNSNIPWILPIHFHQVRRARGSRRYLLSPCDLPSLRCRFSRIDELNPVLAVLVHMSHWNWQLPLERPGTTMERSCPCCIEFLCYFYEEWFLTIHPLIRIHMIFQSVLRDRTSGVSSRSCTVRNKSKSLTSTLASSFVSTDPFAVMTVVGRRDARTVSNSAEGYHVVWCRFRMLRSFFCVSGPGRVFRKMRYVVAGAHGRGPIHLLVWSAGTIGFSSDPEQCVWVRPGPPQLCHLASSDQYLKGAISNAWGTSQLNPPPPVHLRVGCPCLKARRGPCCARRILRRAQFRC